VVPSRNEACVSSVPPVIHGVWKKFVRLNIW
jgi:hypothetical protein